MTQESELHLLLHDTSDFFGLGHIVACNLIDGGRNSKNYYVETASGGEFVVRIFNNFNAIRLYNETILHGAMEDADVPTARLVVSDSGDYVLKKGGTFVTVSRYISGSHPDENSLLSDVRLIGTTLGIFHTQIDPTISISNRYLFVGNTRLNERLWYLPPEYKDRIVDIFLYTQILDRSRVSLPVGILHGDFHRGNVLIQKDRAYILDFQSIGVGPYILDIGRSIADICRIGQRIDEKKVKAFMQGYQSRRELCEIEEKLIGKSIVFGASCIALWSYEKGIVELGDDMVAFAKSVIDADSKGFTFS